MAVTAAPPAEGGDNAPTGQVDPAFWRDRSVLITGHTGFKGAWLSVWLTQLGANVTGVATKPPTNPSLYDKANVRDRLKDEITADVRDPDQTTQAIKQAQPDTVIHMAAQSLVRPSFENPRDTYETNVMGTVHVLDAVRTQTADATKALVVVTSDKCYENREWEWGYREDEPMGGHDPYSNSKGCAELVTDAFRRSFFDTPETPNVASARAGNVIGGGDWAKDRLVPDIMRGALEQVPIRIRNPNALRPWQHVLNPLSGYLVLAQALHDDDPVHAKTFATGFNFGPADEDTKPVSWLVERITETWPHDLEWQLDPGPHPHEATYLKLDSSRARARLNWRPNWDLQQGLDATVQWYLALRDNEDPAATTQRQIEAFQYAGAPAE